MPPRKFVTVEIPLIELSSDSEPSVQQPPAVPAIPSPATSHGTSDTRTPRRFPTVSDDYDDDEPETPPGFGRSSPDTPLLPVRRSPVPPPARPPPRPISAPAPLPPPAPYYPRGAPMTAGRPPTYQTAIRDYPPGFPPRPRYERGESSRQPDYRLQHMREISSLSTQLRDTRHAFFELQGSHTHVLDRLGEFEQTVGTLRRDVEYRTEEVAADARRTTGALDERATDMEFALVVAGVLALVAVLIGVLLYFYRR